MHTIPSQTPDSRKPLSSFLHRPPVVGLLSFVTLALAALPAAWPYFGDGLPRTNDALPHLYRSLALGRLVRAGVLWPRWSPDLVHGYGYPVFHFFPSLSHYPVVLCHLAGLPLTTAYRAVVLIHFVLAAWFAYLLARDLFGAAGGWVAALAYAYSPYLLYDAHVRGGLPESQALALLPLLFLTLRRATLHGGRWLVASALVFAAAFLSHFPIAFQFLIPVGVLLAWWAWRRGWRHLWKPVVGLVLGVLITAFFWMPVLTEVQYVRSDISISQGYNYRDNFLRLRDLLTWPRLPADPALVNPPVVRSLPLVALAMVALVLPWRWRSLNEAARRQVGLWLCLSVICTALVMPLSLPAWEVVPLLKLTLYPWRLLGGASLASALLLAGALTGLAVRPRTLALLVCVTSLLLIGGIPWLYPPREPVPEEPTIADLTAFENPPLFIGTTTLGEFLPRWAEQLPDTADLRSELASGESPDRLVVPEGVTIHSMKGSPLDATYQIQAEQLATLTYRQFYFPGWRATLDGAPLSPRPSHPEGLVLLDVPAGTHTLRVTFGSTLPRVLGWVISGLGALALIAILAGVGIPIRPVRGEEPRPGAPSPAAASALPRHWLLLLVGVVLAVKLFFDTVDTPLRRSTLTPEGLYGIQHPHSVDFAGELRLLGHEQSAEYIPADGEVTLTLYWRPRRPIGVTYDVAVHVVDENGQVWSAGDAIRPRYWRFAPGTDLWPLDGYVMDPFVLRLLDGTPPGEYAFHVALVRHGTGQTVADHELGHLLVTQPARGDCPLEEGMRPAPATYAWAGLRLLGSRTDRSDAAPGDPARITLLWQVTDPNAVADEGRFTLRLVTADGEEILATTAPVAGSYPPLRWQPGDRLRTQVVLRLPARTPSGEHSWNVQVRDGNHTAARTIAPLHIQAPERRWDPPPLDVTTNASLGGVATLLGATIEPPSFQLHPSTTVTVTLAWQAEAETTLSYRVFLHLVREDGQLIAQSDGEPANWTRPTTGWLIGEVVMDERVLRIPADTRAGEYVLLCGLYNLDTLERLSTTDGTEAIPVARLVVDPP